LDGKGNCLKNMELITNDLSKLVVIDDSIITYNLYKSNSPL